jgi:hypothetical protein
VAFAVSRDASELKSGSSFSGASAFIEPISEPLGQMATTPCDPTQRAKPSVRSSEGGEPKAKRDFLMS